MQYGVDVAKLRADDLDKLLLRNITTRVAGGDIPTVLDIGCASGTQSMRMATAGAKVTGLDIKDFSADFTIHIAELKKIHLASQLNFVQADIVSWLIGTDNKFDLICVQRMLHYLPYRQAIDLLRQIAKRKEVELYLSVTGATSAIASRYPGLNNKVEKRFSCIDQSLQAVFSITAPVCLYYESELLDLLGKCGFQIIQSRVSDFGNIKVVAEVA